MKNLQPKLQLLQKTISQIQTIDKFIVFKLVSQFRKELNLTTILETLQIKQSAYYYWLLLVKNKKRIKFQKTNHTK
ncbi:hypothetical protein [Candidatus Phytoplasma meliae]|uniref:Transposase n=1 Tax=Candidatus Phytoplasma meliae TaxID=1848402 RepID=A0ABS5CYZ7_9MOLU|nr:hypothetical protein [Candidatus Phytoplasma meliae]MBP5835789.1 hypothetical protein [Candidatus Phytoplasma meliae]MBP5836200.1 hypothetical protein [Candidatus Phytoplasma meliae]